MLHSELCGKEWCVHACLASFSAGAEQIQIMLLACLTISDLSVLMIRMQSEGTYLQMGNKLISEEQA